MIKVLLTILCSIALAATLFAQANAKAAIISAAEKFVAANSAVATRVSVLIEKVDSKYARAKATPRDPKKADPAWIFLKKENHTWTGLTLGTGFSPEDYRKLGIPRSLWID